MIAAGPSQGDHWSLSEGRRVAPRVHQLSAAGDSLGPKGVSMADCRRRTFEVGCVGTEEEGRVNDSANAREGA